MVNLEKRLLKTVDLLVHAKKLSFDSYRMMMGGHEVFYVVHRNSFLRRVREGCWALAIIEMAKIFSYSSQEDFRISLLINDMIRNYGDINWINIVSIEELKSMSREINRGGIRRIINDLVEMRKQHYAHTDINPLRSIDEIPVYYEELSNLIEKGERILEKLMRSLYRPDFCFEPYEGEEAHSFLRQIVNEREELGRLRLKLDK